MTTVREATYDFLREQGMTTVFGNPGSTELPFLEQFPDDFRYVLGLHEGVAVGMADGYAQASGRPAIVNLHTAPGVGNAMGALFTAQANHSPLVVTAGQQARSLMTLQALLTNRDAARMPHPLVKWSYEPPRAEDVPHAIARATHLAALPPRGPVFVSIPMDDWRAEVDDDAVGHQTSRSVSGRAAADPELVHALARRLAAAANPVLVVGPDTDASGGWDAAVELAERARLPVWAPPATGGGRIGFPEDHAHFRGVLPPAVGPLSETLAGHDLIVVVGSQVFAYYPNLPAPLLPAGAALVAITSDPDEAARAPMGDAIVADVRLTLEALLAHVEPSDRPPPEPRAAADPPEDTDPMSASAAIAALADVFPDEGVVVPESPATTFAIRNRLRLRHPGSYYFTAGGGLGFAPPRRDRRADGAARAARGLRAGRGLGPVRDPGAVDRRRLRRAGDVPGPAQRGVRDPQVVRRDRAGHRRARARPARARGRLRGRGLRRAEPPRRRSRRAARGTPRGDRRARPAARRGARRAWHGARLGALARSRR